MSTTLLNNVELWTSAVRHKSTAGRGSNRKLELAGINKLRELILELAVRGKLVPQNPDDEPASELLKRIEAEKAQLVKDGKLKKQKPLPVVSDDEKPFELPQGWEWVRLGKLCELITSGSRDWAKYYSETGAKFITMGNLSRGSYELRMNNLRFVTPPDNSEGQRTKLQAYDIVISITGDVGNLGLIPENFGEAYINQHSCLVRLTEVQRGRYIPELFRSTIAKKQFDEPQRGIKNSFRLSDVDLLMVPLPPLAEQQRIVAKVDELMALCDQLEQQSEHQLDAHQQLTETLLSALLNPAAGALTNATSAQELSDNWQRLANHFDLLFSGPMGAWAIDRLKDTILQLAVMGKLVPQNPDDEPAAELLKRIDAEKARLVKEGKIKKQKPLPPVSDDEKPFEMPQGWEWVRLGKLCELITSGSRDWAQYYSETGAKFITMGNLSRGSYDLRMNTLRFVTPPSNSEGQRTKLQAHDIIISITGDVGNLGLVPENFGEAYINQHSCLVRLFDAQKGRYIPEVLRSAIAKQQFDEPQRGIKNSFRLSDVDYLIIPLPPLAEQHRIVAKVDELFALCDQLKERLQHASDTQLNLTAAIVEQALN